MKMKTPDIFLLFLISGIFFSVPSGADDKTSLASTREYWPTEEWRENPHDMTSGSCKDFVDYMTGHIDKKKGINTDTMAVIHGGKLVYEWYDGKYKKDSLHCLWSGSKSVNGAMIGAAVNDGKLSTDARLSSFFPRDAALASGANEKFYNTITIDHLLEMSAGFDWAERYEDDISKSSVLKMLYIKGYKDTADFAAHAPLRSEGPGKYYIYSSGNINMMQAILGKTYPESKDSFPWKILFDRIGMKSVVYERDGAGTFIGSSYVHSNTRDLAKFGYLYLNDGIWEQKRVLPAGWVEKTQKPSDGMLSELTPIPYIQEEGVYSKGGFWLNLPVRTLPAPFPNSPKDLYFAAGHYGQLVYIIPSLDLVFVRTGHDAEYWSKIDEMVKRAVACFAPGGNR